MNTYTVYSQNSKNYKDYSCNYDRHFLFFLSLNYSEFRPFAIFLINGQDNDIIVIFNKITILKRNNFQFCVIGNVSFPSPSQISNIDEIIIVIFLLILGSSFCLYAVYIDHPTNSTSSKSCVITHHRRWYLGIIIKPKVIQIITHIKFILKSRFCFSCATKI